MSDGDQFYQWLGSFPCFRIKVFGEIPVLKTSGSVKFTFQLVKSFRRLVVPIDIDGELVYHYLYQNVNDHESKSQIIISFPGPYYLHFV